jgi:hypothetical protein
MNVGHGGRRCGISDALVAQPEGDGRIVDDKPSSSTRTRPRLRRDLVAGKQCGPEDLPAISPVAVVVIVVMGTDPARKEGQCQGEGSHEKGSVAHLKPP